jgi:hypothetical protein
MSVAIAIGNDTQDIVNIQNTINLLQYIADGSSSFETLKKISPEDIDNLIDWYKGIVNILLDPSLFSYDESHSSM